MPNPPSVEFPKPENWQDFEDICTDLLKEMWNDPYAKKFGRPGQSQHGIDIVGSPEHVETGRAVAQCKRVDDLTYGDIEDEVEDADDYFEPPLKEFILITTFEKDNDLEKELRQLSEEREAEGKFPVRILFWEDICLKLSGHRELMIKHYPQFVENNESLDSIRQKIMNSELEDWKYSSEEEVYLFKSDVKLKIESEDWGESREYEEEWHQIYPNPNAQTQHHRIYYNNTFLEKVNVVSVDRGVKIPFPEYEYNREENEIENLHLTEWKYKIGRILNKHNYEVESQMPFRGRNNFEGKLERAEISYPD